ncbi:hypothetical protein [Jiangella mangrovi]|uniref:DUF3800 domain-containing protein n=1 Tax=Jiangella mangrovi TaxID=1524084 RepID=A0A7W9GVC5_9ACTN|nr:hypothetical protein [Jiangella mangrovi]MBB5790411.1 hypothetical protein [Jiangella mangrovi]
MPLLAFADESSRQGYLLCVVTVRQAEAGDVRKAMRALVAKGAGRLHMNDESDQRRRRILGVVRAQPIEAVLYVTRRKPIRDGRAEIIRTVVPDLLTAGADRLVLEAQVGQDVHDRRVLFDSLQKAGRPGAFEYVHESPHAEPLLWVPDAVAWAYGRQGEWRPKVATVVRRVVEVL